MKYDETLLKIRRKFSKDEKYRLLLKYLTDTEENLAKERRMNTNLMATNTTLQQRIVSAQKEIETLKNSVINFQLKFKEIVPTTMYKKVIKERDELRKQHRKTVEQNIDLNIKINKLISNQTG